jgi:hypothetical protein
MSKEFSEDDLRSVWLVVLPLVSRRLIILFLDDANEYSLR